MSKKTFWLGLKEWHILPLSYLGTERWEFKSIILKLILNYQGVTDGFLGLILYHSELSNIPYWVGLFCLFLQQDSFSAVDQN